MLLIDNFDFDSLQVLEENKNAGTMKLRGVCQRADAPNKNNRIYSKALLEREFKKLMPLISERRLIGELDHPSGPIVSLKNASHIVTEVYFQGNDAMCIVELLNTPAGKVAQSLISDGVKLGISSRALGSLGSPDSKGYAQVNEDLKFVTWDLVADPSTKEAFVGLNESTMLEEGIPIQDKISKVIRERVLIEALKQNFSLNEAESSAEEIRRKSKETRALNALKVKALADRLAQARRGDTQRRVEASQKEAEKKKKEKKVIKTLNSSVDHLLTIPVKKKDSLTEKQNFSGASTPWSGKRARFARIASQGNPFTGSTGVRGERPPPQGNTVMQRQLKKANVPDSQGIGAAIDSKLGQLGQRQSDADTLHPNAQKVNTPLPAKKRSPSGIYSYKGPAALAAEKAKRIEDLQKAGKPKPKPKTKTSSIGPTQGPPIHPFLKSIQIPTHRSSRRGMILNSEGKPINNRWNNEIESASVARGGIALTKGERQQRVNQTVRKPLYRIIVNQNNKVSSMHESLQDKIKETIAQANRQNKVTPPQPSKAGHESTSSLPPTEPQKPPPTEPQKPPPTEPQKPRPLNSGAQKAKAFWARKAKIKELVAKEKEGRTPPPPSLSPEEKQRAASREQAQNYEASISPPSASTASTGAFGKGVAIGSKVGAMNTNSGTPIQKAEENHEKPYVARDPQMFGATSRIGHKTTINPGMTRATMANPQSVPISSIPRERLIPGASPGRTKLRNQIGFRRRLGRFLGKNKFMGVRLGSGSEIRKDKLRRAGNPVPGPRTTAGMEHNPVTGRLDYHSPRGPNESPLKRIFRGAQRGFGNRVRYQLAH